MRAGRFLQQTKLQRKQDPNMRTATGLLVSLLTFLMGRAGGIELCRVRCSGTRCFSVLHHATGFAAARDRCGDLGGHLMTVQFSSNQSILPNLLGELTGRYWIGLHRVTKCPDAAAELRGFAWVTGGNRSESTHWSAAFDGDCSSPRCVSVSKEDDFKWVQEPCADNLPGFLCEHGPGDPCQALTDAPGDSVTYTPPVGGSGEVVWPLPPGSIALRITAKTKYFCLAGKWQPATRSCNTHEGDCQGGYKSRGGRCVDVDECASAPCEHSCVNTPGSYECSCYPGYKKDANYPHKCALFCGKEECAAECDPNNPFQCYCPDGYVADERRGGTVCLDIDECSSDYCDHLCRNTFGSYVCTCSPGYTLVHQFQCVKNEGGPSEEPEGSAEATSQSFPTTTARPEPTRRPQRVSVGGLAGITVCTVLLILLVLFVVHRVLSGRAHAESGGARKAAQDEAHSSQRVTRDA
ncbi:thrombomodulin [Pungitius pungitius]|uniref:thrombomodulin n=1 Tax=Pungitius pungitius TaxID=134920 RepID=UPI002E107274